MGWRTANDPSLVDPWGRFVMEFPADPTASTANESIRPAAAGQASTADPIALSASVRFARRCAQHLGRYHHARESPSVFVANVLAFVAIFFAR
jgi:hypothetical protein